MNKENDDLRYQKIEWRIVNTLVDYFRIAEDAATFDKSSFCKTCGIAELTLHNHGGVDGMLRKMSDSIERNMKGIAKDSMEKGHDAAGLYLHVMRSIIGFQRYYKIYFLRHDTRLWEISLRELRPAVEQIWRSGYGKEKDEKIYTLYRGEITAIFSFWAECDFSDGQFSYVKNRLIQLTNGAPARLSKLI